MKNKPKVNKNIPTNNKLINTNTTTNSTNSNSTKNQIKSSNSSTQIFASTKSQLKTNTINTNHNTTNTNNTNTNTTIHNTNKTNNTTTNTSTLSSTFNNTKKPKQQLDKPSVSFTTTNTKVKHTNTKSIGNLFKIDDSADIPNNHHLNSSFLENKSNTKKYSNTFIDNTSNLSQYNPLTNEEKNNLLNDINKDSKKRLNMYNLYDDILSNIKKDIIEMKECTITVTATASDKVGDNNKKNELNKPMNNLNSNFPTINSNDIINNTNTNNNILKEIIEESEINISNINSRAQSSEANKLAVDLAASDGFKIAFDEKANFILFSDTSNMANTCTNGLNKDTGKDLDIEDSTEYIEENDDEEKHTVNIPNTNYINSNSTYIPSNIPTYNPNNNNKTQKNKYTFY